MKRKIVKVKSAKLLTDRLRGVGTFRVTGPSESGERVTVLFTGTRQQAEKVKLQ